MNEEQKKFCEAEVILGVFFFGGIDAIAILLDLTGVGMAIAPVIQAFAMGAMIFWFWWKGNKQAIQLGRVVAKFVATAIPIVPTNLIIFCVSAYFHNHPEKARFAQRLQRSAKIAGRVAGVPSVASPKVSERAAGVPVGLPVTGTEG